MRGLGLTLGLMLAAAPALAQQTPAKPDCPAMDRALPAGFSAWTAQTPLAAASSAAGLPKVTLTPGTAVTATLPLTSEVRFVTPPEKTADGATHSGLFEIKVDSAGTYVVGLGAGAWIDVLKDGKALTSSAHDHGPACSTLRKMVEFPLQPGRYVLQVSGAASARLSILVTKRS